jgi:transposase
LIETLRLDLLQLRAQAAVLPKSPLGKAIDYTLGQWEKLQLFFHHGQIEIDNNGIENSIRPTAIGKKNWLFIGGEDTGERSAILYTLIESDKRHGHEPYTYLKDILERLPGMKSNEVETLLPSNWQPAEEIPVPRLAFP